MRTGWQCSVCEQGGNIENMNRVAIYRVCEQGGNI